MRYLSTGHAVPGEYLVGDTPEGLQPMPGIVTVPGVGGLTRQIAVNVDPRESDPARLSIDEFLAAVTPLHRERRDAPPRRAAQEEDRQRIWQYVLVLMAASLVVESFVARRV
jgi:hypothetical protein